jgi:aminopeptidase N
LDDTNYKERLRRVFEVHQTELAGNKAPRTFEFFFQAQILWDETMAETIASFLRERPDYHLVVLAGNGHLVFGSGIPKRAHRRLAKDYAIVLPDPGELLEPGVADYIVFPSELAVPEDAKLGVILDTSRDQLEIEGLVEDGGAQKAGLEKKDIILAVDGRQVEDIDDLKANLATKYVGDTVKVQVRRDEALLEFMVELGAPVRRGR